jgi:hypothetical protein
MISMAKKSSDMHWSKEAVKLLVFVAVFVIIAVIIEFVVYIGTALLPANSPESNTINNVGGAVNHGISLLASPLVLLLIGVVAIVILLFVLHKAEVI